MRGIISYIMYGRRSTSEWICVWGWYEIHNNEMKTCIMYIMQSISASFAVAVSIHTLTLNGMPSCCQTISKFWIKRTDNQSVFVIKLLCMNWRLARHWRFNSIQQKCDILVRVHSKFCMCVKWTCIFFLPASSFQTDRQTLDVST